MTRIKFKPEVIDFLKSFGTIEALENGTQVITVPGIFIIKSEEYGLVDYIEQEETEEDDSKEENL